MGRDDDRKIPGLLGRASFKPGMLEQYIVFYTNNMADIRSQLLETNKKAEPASALAIGTFDFFNKYMDYHFGKFESPDKFIKDIEKINNYLFQTGGQYFLKAKGDSVAVINYGRKVFVILDADNYLDVEYYTDYSQYTLSQLKALAAGESNSSPVSLMVPDQNISKQDLEYQAGQLDHVLGGFKENLKKIENNQAEELDALNKEMEAIKEQMRQKELELEEKKKNLMAELNKKMAGFNEKKKELEKQIEILGNTIYSIQCYLGETIELNKIREGTAAKIDTPLIINQKLKYLDEDLGLLFSIYDVNAGEYKIIEDLMKHNDLALEYFCPSEKCITFFKVSKDGKGFSYNDVNSNFLEDYDVYHGNRLGFLIRNGENAFIGWADEEKITLSEEDIYLKAGVKVQASDEPVTQKSSDYKNVVSRVFIFSILQGLVEKPEIVSFPEQVNIFVPNNKYIVFSYADAWLADNRFGDFKNLVKRLNRINIAGDDIVIIQSLRETSQKVGISDRGRGDAYQNRTYDCGVPDGLNKINLVEEGKVYISAKKEYSITGARANFLLESDEFINLTYWNSEWLQYYLVNKKVTGISRNLNFTYFIKYLKQALDLLVKREVVEETEILNFYPELDKVNEWVVILSHWKIQHRVRAITPFQAKRFAKYLQSGQIKMLKNIFEGPYHHPNQNINWNKLKVTELTSWYKSNERYLNVSSATDDEIEERYQQDIKKVRGASKITARQVEKYGYTHKDIEEFLNKTASDSQYLSFIKYIKPDFSFIDYEAAGQLSESIVPASHVRFAKNYYLFELYSIYCSIFNAVIKLEEEKYELTM